MNIKNMIGQQNKPQTIAIVLTAVSVIPVYQGFNQTPMVLMAVILLGLGYIIAAGNLNRGGIAAVCLPVFVGGSLLFGLFAGFQFYRIMSAVINWLDGVLTTFFQWIG